MDRLLHHTKEPHHANVIFVYRLFSINLDAMSYNFLHLVYPNYLILVVGTVTKIYAPIAFATRIRPIDVSTNFDSIFNDKMRNLNGYSYKIVVGDQRPRLDCEDSDNCEGIDLTTMRIIAEKQNARIVLRHVETGTVRWTQEYIQQLSQSDMAIVTAARSIGDINNYYLLNTYDEYAFCAAVPIPPRLSFLEFSLVPFDLITWLTFAVLVVACAILWKLLSRLPRSAWRFIAAVAADFVGQSVEMQGDRRVLVLLLKLCLLMSFILGNAYQSLIIAFMMTSREGVRFKTFNELIDSGITIAAPGDVQQWISFKGQDIKSVYKAPMFHTNEFAFRNFSWITRCDVLDLYFMTTKALSENMYILPDTTMKGFEKIVLGLGTHETLQRYFDRLFETGIRQYLLNSLQLQEKQKIFELRQKNEYLEKEEYLLTLADIYGIMFILLGGLTTSFLVFTLEQICFSWEKLKRLALKCCKKRKKKVIEYFRGRSQVVSNN